jgi:hypothetical protein
MSGKVLWILVTIVATSGLWGCQQEVDRPISTTTSAVSFDRSQWQRNRGSEGGEMGENGILQTRMAIDLVNNKTLIGKSRKEIEQMLGISNVLYGDLQEFQSQQIRYTVRTAFNGIDPISTEELMIKLDDRSKAVSAYIQYRRLPNT